MESKVVAFKILITRSRNENIMLAKKIESYGFEPINIPLIKVEKLDLEDIKVATKKSAYFDWIIITSPNSAKYFFSLVDKKKFNSQIAVTYKKSAKTVQKYGFNPDFVGDGKGASSLIKGLSAKYNLNGQRLLYPCSAISDDTVKKEAARAGAKDVVQIPVYKNSPINDNNTASRLLQAYYDVALFYSPSAVNNFVSIFKKGIVKIDVIQAVAIGPKTATALKQAGVKHVVEATDPDFRSVIIAIDRLLKEKKNNILE